MASYFSALLEKLKKNKPLVAASAASVALLSAFIVNSIQKSGPHHTTSRILSHGLIGSPKVKTGGTKTENAKFDEIKGAMKDFIQSGQDIAAQITVFVKNEEKLNYFAADSNRCKNYDSTSLHTVFSSTKNMAALFIAIAVNNGWIQSYDDNINKYWPEFPTKQRMYKVKKDKKGKRTVTFEAINEEKYLKICDVLRHEAGLDKLWGDDKKIYFKETGYDDMRRHIEESTLSYREFEEKDKIPASDRCYHAITRGFILNELFRRVEPKKRSMNAFFVDEILPILSMNDDEFKLYLKGRTGGDKTEINHIENANTFWIIYHFVIPYMLNVTAHLPKKHYFEKYVNGIKYSNFARLKELVEINIVGKENCDYCPEFTASRKIKNASIKYEDAEGLKMEWMSCSGITNAHSMAKLLSHYLFNENTNITKNFGSTLEEMMRDPVSKYDATILSRSNFTAGGFNNVNLFGIEWFLWGGLGGSYLAFSKKYECVFAFTVTGHNRMDLSFDCNPNKQHFGQEPRGNVIFYYLAKYLKSL